MRGVAGSANFRAMTAAPGRKLTSAEYLEIEREAEWKSEFYDGEMFAMAGVSLEHCVIVSNLVAALHSQMKGRPCNVYANDLRVKVQDNGLYTYPDVIALCDKPQLEDANMDTLLNPSVLIEVLSKSTEAYDRGKKFGLYRLLPTLREYVLVAQDEMKIEKFTLGDDGQWRFSEASGMDGVMRLEAINCTLPLAEVYEKVEFPGSETRAA